MLSPSPQSAIARATAAAIAAGPLALGATSSDASMGKATAPALPLLEVRGCTPIDPKSSRFEINLGQQLAHASSLEWQVSLMWPVAQRVRRASYSSLLSTVEGGGGNSGRRIVSGAGVPLKGGAAAAAAAAALKPALKFQLYTLHKSDAKWLTLGGRREGELVEGEIQVTFSDGRRVDLCCGILRRCARSAIRFHRMKRRGTATDQTQILR